MNTSLTLQDLKAVTRVFGLSVDDLLKGAEQVESRLETEYRRTA